MTPTAAVTAKLYSISLSHPARAARLMLEHKGVRHEVVDLLPGLHPIFVRAAGFRDGCVPAVRIDGRRVQGSLAISRALDEMVPDPPLFPADPAARRAVEEAEAWGERELQPIPRRVFRFSLSRNHDLRRFMASEVAGLPAPEVMALGYVPVSIVFARISGASETEVRSDLRRLPALLDHVDELIEAGTIGADEPNAAGFQILPTVRLLAAMGDLGPLLQGRPCKRAAKALIPEHVGPIALGLPREWIPAAG